jgi:tRNA(adenine34) deaminase
MATALFRRSVFVSLSGISARPALPAVLDTSALMNIPLAEHERIMRLAIAEARSNPVYPFGAVIVRTSDHTVLARGVNSSIRNPILHGEIVAMNDYVARNGNRDWNAALLYTTGEPCPMCMSALVWAGIGGVVFASSIEAIKRAGINQIEIPARAVIDAAPFFKGALLGGVLAAETDVMFSSRKRD